MELQNGRPENTDKRLDKEIRVYDFLDKLQEFILMQSPGDKLLSAFNAWR